MLFPVQDIEELLCQHGVLDSGSNMPTCWGAPVAEAGLPKEPPSVLQLTL